MRNRRETGRGNTESGVTLIEILIAISLLSLLSVGMLMAMRLGLNTMDKTDARLVRDRRVANTRAIIENEIQGFIFTVAFYHPNPNELRQVPFLQTEAQSMRFVTSYSLDEAWRGRPRIAAMQVIPGERNQGVRLIVNETPYTGPEQAGRDVLGIELNPSGPQIVRFAPIVPGAASFVLADRLAFCRFAYLEPRREAPFQVWRPDWVQPQLLPLAVRIEMAPIDIENSSELHISTVTVPLNVNRVPGTTYVDPPQ
jgi:prepilin-type N-terminal cleavage/methylation domain-containing protein